MFGKDKTTYLEGEKQIAHTPYIVQITVGSRLAASCEAFKYYRTYAKARVGCLSCRMRYSSSSCCLSW